MDQTPRQAEKDLPIKEARAKAVPQKSTFRKSTPPRDPKFAVSIRSLVCVRPFADAALGGRLVLESFRMLHEVVLKVALPGQ